MNKKILAAAVACLFLFALAAPASAVAATGNQSFTDIVQGKLTADGPTPTHTVVVANGVINAVGTDEFVPSQPGCRGLRKM